MRGLTSAGTPPRSRTGAALRGAAFDTYLVTVNLLLRIPGHEIRLMVLRRLCRWGIGKATYVERGIRATTKGGVRIGSNCIIHRNVTLDGRGGLTIGDQVDIAPEVMCLTADHDPDSPTFLGRLRSVTIGSRVWIATRAVVLPGATLNDGVVVGAGSVVSGEISAWTVVAGCPARKVRDRSPDAQKSLPHYRRWFH